MRKSLWITLSKLTVVAAALACSLTLQAPVANADITYIFTGTGSFAGTDFTYEASDYLSFPTIEFSPTTSTDLFVGGNDLGPILSVTFVNSLDALAINSNIPFYAQLDGTDEYNLTTPGTQILDGGTLDIVTPEPGTAILWLTGIGLMILTRKRITHLFRFDTGTQR